MTSIYYNSPLGNTSASTGTNDFLLVSTLDYHKSLASFKDRYIPYVIEHTTLNEWEYGLGIVIDNAGQDVLIRGGNLSYPLTVIYSSSNNNTRVNFSSGTKNVKSIISPERINHGGNNYSYQNSNFIADTVQTTYGILASGSAITVNLPLASGNKNLVLGFRLLDDSDNDLTIIPSGSDKIDGASSTTLTTVEKYTSLISDGSGWYELVPMVDVSSAGLPVGSVGSIQFKQSSTDFNGSDLLFWQSTSGILLIGDDTVSGANAVIPSSSGHNILFNQQKHNSDFVVYGTGNNQLFYDASTGRLGVNTNSPSTILHVVGRCANDTMRLESATECPTGVALTLYHSPNTGSQTGDHPATINLAGRNSNGQQVNYAQIRSKILGTSIGNTSGELVFNVDQFGISQNIATFNVGSVKLGLNTAAPQNINNIVIGQLSKDSGNNNILIGHSGFISGVLSSKNTFIGNDSILSGSNNVVVGNNSYISGSNIQSFGNNVNITSSNNFNIGSSNINGTSDLSIGSGNSISGNNTYVLGNNNITSNNTNFILGTNNISNQTNGYVIGLNHNSSGTNNHTYGESVYATGSQNVVLGSQCSVVGSINNSLGSYNIINGSGNTVFGNNITTTGSGNTVIGKNINLNANDSVVFGSNGIDLSVSSTALIYNSGLNNSRFIVYGTGNSSGLFYQNNLFGFNKIPNDYLLDINGDIRSTGIFTNNLRYGLSSVSGSVLVSDSSGNASWKDLSSVQSSLVEDLIDNAIVIKQSNEFNSASGLYWSSASGLYLAANSGINTSFIVASTGNGPFIVNHNRLSSTNVFNIKDSDNENLILANSTNKRVGVNITPAYNFHVSGVSRLQNSSLDYIEKNTNQFIINYDNSLVSFRNWNISSSGFYIRQTNAGSLIPIQTFSSSTPSISLMDNVNIMVLEYDPSSLNYQIKYTSGIYAGFRAFNGSTADF